MKTRVVQSLSILLALLLQVAPLLRSLLPAAQGLAPSTWAIVLKIGVGAVALLGFDAVSQASSISISPPNATAGTPYSGVVTYSGGHSGSVTSMMVSNNCIGSTTPFFDRLSIVYSRSSKATVTGTPTAAASYAFTVKVWSGSGCGGSHSDSRASTLVIGASGGGNVASTTFLYRCPRTPWPNRFRCGVERRHLRQSIASISMVAGRPADSRRDQFRPDHHQYPACQRGVLLANRVKCPQCRPDFRRFAKGQLLSFRMHHRGNQFYDTLDYTNYAPAGQALTMFQLCDECFHRDQ